MPGLIVFGCVGILEMLHRNGALIDLRSAYSRLVEQKFRIGPNNTAAEFARLRTSAALRAESRHPGSSRCAGSLYNPEALKRRNLRKVDDECKSPCRHQRCAHKSRRQRSHGDSEDRQGRCNQQIGCRRCDQPPAGAAGPHALVFPIGIGRSLVAEHDGYEGHRPQGFDSKAQAESGCCQNAVCLEDMERLLNGPVSDWLRKGSDFRVVVDITGGSKAMSAALTMVARRWNCTISYVGGARRSKGGLGVVEDAHEKIFEVGNPVEQLGWTVIEDALALAGANNFDSAVRLLDGAKKRLSHPEAIREIAAFQHTVEFFACRDRFDFRRASDKIDDIRRTLNDLRAVLDGPSIRDLSGKLDLWKAETLDLAGTSQVSLVLIRELLANAERRHSEGRYDDALARLYRGIEAVAQYRMLEAYNIPDTGRVPVSQLPPLMAKAHGAAVGPVQLGLQSDYAFLKELQDPLGIAFYRESLNEKTSPLNTRNRSILAHGFQAIGTKDFDALWTKSLRLAETIGVRSGDFPRFPRLIGRGQSGA